MAGAQRILRADEARDRKKSLSPLLSELKLRPPETLGGVPIANFDENQHSPNENLRVGNLWKGMEIYGEILAGLEWG